MALAGMRSRPRPAAGLRAERAAMRERIERVAALFDFATEARDSLARARRRA